VTVQVKLYDQSGGTLTGILGLVRGVQWQDPRNEAGVLTFDLHNSDPLFPDTNVLRVVEVLADLGDGAGLVARGKFQVESVATQVVAPGEVADEWSRVTARNLLCWLEDAVVDAEDVGYPRIFDERPFSFAASDWPTYDAGDWTAPTEASTSPFNGSDYPESWPANDTQSKLVWFSDPMAAGTDGVYREARFRAALPITTAGFYRVAAAADDNYVLWVAGEEVLRQDKDVLRWRRADTMDVWFPVGEPHLAAMVWDVRETTSWFMCSVSLLDADGEPTGTPILYTSAGGGWEVHEVYPANSPVGFTLGETLKKLVDEAQARGALPDLTYDFTDTLDSNGDPWDAGVVDRSFTIGSTIWEVVEQLVELGLDVEVTPGRVLRAYQGRGSDVSASVQFLPGVNLLEHEVTKTRARKTALMKRTNVDRSYSVDATSVVNYGRREGFVSLGNTSSRPHADRVADNLLTGAASSVPTRQITSSVLLVDGARPYVDFNLGDTVGTVDEEGDPLDVTVVGFTFAQEPETGRVLFTPEWVSGTPLVAEWTA
jgi:hypothetical protein